jgi:catechol 2,3-dioxygenase-like lactoylglutathione lyase family enzyme
VAHTTGELTEGVEARPFGFRVRKEWSAKGAKFLTEPKDHGREIRAYVRDPDGHLIEVGQATGILT